MTLRPYRWAALAQGFMRTSPWPSLQTAKGKMSLFWLRNAVYDASVTTRGRASASSEPSGGAAAGALVASAWL